MESKRTVRDVGLLSFFWGASWVLAFHWAYFLANDRLPTYSLDGKDASLSFAILSSVIGGCVGAFSGMVGRRSSGSASILFAVVILGYITSLEGPMRYSHRARASAFEEVRRTVSIVTAFLMLPSLLGNSLLGSWNWAVRSLASGLCSIMLIMALQQPSLSDLTTIRIWELFCMCIAGVMSAIPGNPPRLD